MNEFVLTPETPEELRTGNGWKKLRQQRAIKADEGAKRIFTVMESTGETDNVVVNQIAGEVFDDMGFTDYECRKIAFNLVKQRLVKKAKSHFKQEGEHRSIYFAKQGKYIDIYKTRNLETLKEVRASIDRRAASYQETLEDIDMQIYRVNHGLDNYVEVDLFEALEEAEAVGEV